MDSKGSTSQVIDQYLIDLLGLQDEYELSWEDYFRALREASIAARMSNTKYTSEQAKLITEELKKVKQEDKSTRFSTGIKKKKVNKTKVSAKKVTSISTFVQKQKKEPDVKVKPTQNLLPSSPIEQQKKQKLLPSPKEKKDTVANQKKDERISLLKLLQNIDKTLGSILKTLENGLKFDQKTAEENRKGKERSRRGESENKLEGGLGKGIKSIIGAASKALSPLQDVFDRIKNFIVWVLLGKAFRMFMQWFNDPANQKTFNTIVKFLGDHWLLLVGSYLMFGNSLGRLVTKFIGKLAVFTVKMGVVIARKLLPLIGKLGGKGKLGLAVAGGLAVAAGARALTSGDNKKSKVEPPSKEEITPAPKPETPPTSGFNKGGVVDSFDIKISEEKEKKNTKKEKSSSIWDLLSGGPANLPFNAAKKGLENFDSVKESGLNVAKKVSGFSPALLLANKFGLFGKGNKNKQSVSKFETGGVVGNKKKGKSLPGIGILGKALEYSPLGMGFKAAKFGAENFGKVASGAAGLAGKALEYSPLGLAFKAGKLGAETFGKTLKGATGLAGKGLSAGGKLLKTGVKNTLKLSTLPIAASLSGLQGAGDIVKNGILKSGKVQSQLKDAFSKAQESGALQDPKLIALGGIPGLINLIVKKTTPEVKKNIKGNKKTGGFNLGGVVDPISSGIPISGAGKDNTLIKAKTGDAILTEKDQKDLSKSIRGDGQLPFDNKQNKYGKSNSGFGKDTTIAVRKGEALVTPEQQKGLFEKFGVNIPQWLSGRKPNKIDSDKIKTKTGIGFSNGGIVSGFAGGGIVGDDARTKYDAKHGAGAYDKESARRRASLSQQDAAQEAKKNQKPVYVQSDYVRKLKERAKTQGTTSTLSINGMRVPGGGALLQGATNKANELKNSKFDPSKINATSIAKSATNNLKNKFTKSDSELSAEWNQKALEKQRPWWDKAGLFGGGSRVAKNEAAAKSKQDQKDKREQQINQKARDEYNKILDDMDHPDHEKAWDDGKGYMESLKKKFGAEPLPGSKKSTAKPKPKPKQSKDGGIGSLLKKGDKKDGKGGGLGSLLKKGAKGSLSVLGFIGKNKPAEFGFNAAKSGAKGLLGAIGGLVQGGKSKPKGYFSSSDQKYYKDYNAATSARQTRLTSLESQQRLNKLSSRGANRSSRGVRFDAESKSRGNEVKNRGGAWGQIGRSFAKVFGGEQQKQQLALQDRASSSRIKQAGAASIGRYYSSSDGKYYKDYNAAAKAKQARITSAPKPIAPKPIAPKPIAPKPQVAGGGMGGRRGSGSSPGGLKPKVSKKQGGGLISNKKQNIFDILRQLRSMRSNSLERQGKLNDAYGLRYSNLKTPSKNFLDYFKNDKLSTKNIIQSAFTPNVNSNPQQPKRQSIADSLKEIREMRARSLERQGKSSTSTPPSPIISAAPAPPKIDSATGLVANKTTDAPPPPKIVGMKGGGIVNKITSGIGGFFNKNRKRDLAKKAVSKTTSKGDQIKEGVSNFTGKRQDTQNKKGFWGNIYDTVSSANTGVKSAYDSFKKGKYLSKAANFVGGIPKKVVNQVAKNPKMLKIGGAFGKFGGRMIPGLGVATSAADSAARLERGDKFGAALAGIGAASGATTLATSGAAATGVGAVVPAVAEGVSMVADTALLGKDIFDILSSKDQSPEKLKTNKKIDDSKRRKYYKDVAGQKIKGMAGGGLVGNPEISYQDKLNSMLGSRFGVNMSLPQARPEADSLQDLGDPFRQFGSGLKSLGERAGNIFSPFANLFGGNKSTSASPAPPPPVLPQPMAPMISAPPPPVLPQPMAPMISAPPPPVLPPPITSTATQSKIKKSVMQTQADEIRAMRANSLERQGKKSESYGLNAFNTGKDMSSFFTKGMVMENSGVNMPGGTADRQLTALQPGEYVVPKNTVDKMGKGFLDSIVGSTDSNSAASKIGIKPNTVGDKIKPYSSGNGKSQMIKLPPIKDKGGAGGSQSGGMASGTKEIMFDAQCVNKSASIERQRIMDTLGFITHI